MLTRKIQRHPTVSVSQPPSTGPDAGASTVGIAKIEDARRLRQDVGLHSDAILGAHLNNLFGNFYTAEPGVLNFQNFAKIGEVSSDVADGPHITPTYGPDGVPFVTVLNITSGRVNFANLKYITQEQHQTFQRRARVERGDVLITKDGTIGVPCYVDTDRDFSFFVSVALVKPKNTVLDGRFLTWALHAPYLQNRMRARSRGDMIRHLVLREIRDLTIPVPSLEEQIRIVADLDEFQAKINSLEDLQKETSKELDALMPSILSKAFSGGL